MESSDHAVSKAKETARHTMLASNTAVLIIILLVPATRATSESGESPPEARPPLFNFLRSGSLLGGGGAVASDPQFERHVDSLRSTMFYVCQGSCLCGTVNNRGKVIYCYGDLVPRQGELFEGDDDGGGGASTRDLIAVQLAVWVVGLFLL